MTKIIKLINRRKMRERKEIIRYDLNTVLKKAPAKVLKSLVLISVMLLSKQQDERPS